MTLLEPSCGGCASLSEDVGGIVDEGDSWFRKLLARERAKVEGRDSFVELLPMMNGSCLGTKDGIVRFKRTSTRTRIRTFESYFNSKSLPLFLHYVLACLASV